MASIIRPSTLVRRVSSSAGEGEEEADETTFENANRVLTLAVTMRQALASKIHDRRWRTLKVYRQCFLHSDAVNWMVGHLQQQQQQQQSEAPSSPSENGGGHSRAPEDTGGGGGGGGNTTGNIHNRSELETKAVAMLNELIDAGYVRHVCSDHRFAVSDTSKTANVTLYFRFHTDVIDSDVKSIRRRREVLGELYGGVTTILNEETSTLKLALERLTSTVDKFDHKLDDAHGRILVLEEAIASLSFAIGVVVYVSAGIALRGAVLGRAGAHDDDDDNTYRGGGVINTALIIVYTATIVVMTANWSLKGPNNIFGAILEHVTVLLKLMRLSTDVEEAFNEAVENEGDYSVGSSSTAATDNGDGRTGVPREVIRRKPSVLTSVRRALSRENRASQKLSVKPEVTIKMRECSTLPAVSEWPHRPVFVCTNSDAQPDLAVPEFGQGACPLGVPFRFSSDLFEGTCLIRLQDVPSDDPDGDAEYFFGRRRRFQAIVQGRFKEELNVDQVLTGHEFVRPLKRLPPSWVVHAGVNLIKRLAPGADIVLHDRQPRALAILAATSQVLSADMPGNEPDIASNEIDEDASLFGGMFKKGDVTVARRKRHLAAPNRAAQYKYDTESVYTFDFYQNLLDTATYSLDLGFTKFGLHRSLDGQPIQVLSKTVDGRYLWSFQIWHEKLLPKKMGSKQKGD